MNHVAYMSEYTQSEISINDPLGYECLVFQVGVCQPVGVSLLSLCFLPVHQA